MSTEKNEPQKDSVCCKISDYGEFVAISRELFNTAAFVHETAQFIERNTFNDDYDKYSRSYLSQLAQVIFAATQKQFQLLDLLNDVIDLGQDHSLGKFPKRPDYKPLGVLEMPYDSQKLTAAWRTGDTA